MPCRVIALQASNDIELKLNLRAVIVTQVPSRLGCFTSYTMVNHLCLSGEYVSYLERLV